MFTKHEDMINVNMNYREIQGEALKALLAFTFAISDTISLSQSHNSGMTKEEANQATNEYNEYLKTNGINEGITPTAEEMLEFYKDMAETEEELQELIRKDKKSREEYESHFKKSQVEVERYIEQVFSEFKLIDRDVTCMTPCTFGGPHAMYYLLIEEQIKSHLFHMEELFSPVIKDDEKLLLLDDPTFYREGKIVLMICSHERFASLLLSKEQYEEFKRLNIPHKTV